MGQLALIAQEQDNIEPILSECVKCLESAGVWVYASYRGRGYAVIWADDELLDQATEVLINAGFDATQLTRGRAPQIRTRAQRITVSNRDSNEDGARQISPRETQRAIHGADDLPQREYQVKAALRRTG